MRADGSDRSDGSRSIGGRNRLDHEGSDETIITLEGLVDHRNLFGVSMLGGRERGGRGSRRCRHELA